MYKENTLKYKILATLVAGALLSACNSSRSNDSYSVQAYDPAVQGMEASYKCNDDNSYTTSGITDFDGNASISNAVVVASPELCAFKFVGLEGAIDNSNGKDMEGVTYLIPKGLAQAGETLTASPLSTALANQLGDTVYDSEDSSTIIQLLTDLGLDGLLTDGVDASAIFLKTESVVNSLSTENKAQLLATTAVLSDVIKNNPSATPAQVITTTKKVAETVVANNPSYPLNSSDTPLVVEVPAGVIDDESEEAPVAVVEEGEEQIEPGTATGTGTGSGNGSGN